MLSGLFNFLKLQAVNRVRQKAADDRLGDRENRKRLAARAFLEGYEPDPRLFAEGPDDAPDVVVPDPLVGPSETALPPQAPAVPQLVAAGAGPAQVGDNEYIVRELERIDQNILAIAGAMEQNARSDYQYRQEVIQEQRRKLAQRGAARSQRRSQRRRNFLSGLRRRAAAPVQAAGGRLRRARNALGGGIAGFLALNAISEISKRYDEISESVGGFFEGMQNSFDEFVENAKLFFDIEPEKPSETTLPDNTDLSGPTIGNANTRAAVQMIRQVEGTAGDDGASTFFGGGQPYGNLEGKTFNEVADLQEQFLAEGRGRFKNPETGEEDQSAAVGLGQFLEPEKFLEKYLGEDPATTKFTREKQVELIIAIAAQKRGVDLSKPLTIDDLRKLNDEWAGIAKGNYGQTQRTLEESLSIYKNILKSIQQDVEANTQQPKQDSMVPINAGDPNRNASDPYIYPDGSKLEIGDEVGSLPPVMLDPIIIDQTTKKTASEGAAMKPGFDIASLVLDPSTGISEYAPMLGVG